MTNSKQIHTIDVQNKEQLCARIAAFIRDRDTKQRTIIAIVGAPGSGKSTLLAELVPMLATIFGNQRVAGIPMDGFHLDNKQLDADGTRARKGAPHTFDVGGLRSLLQRLKSTESPVYAPEFDRVGDLSRNGAIRLDDAHNIVLIEGNYLLLNQSGWKELATLFDLTVSIDVPHEVLHERLVKRWLDHGLTAAKALTRAESNDIPNAVVVCEQSTTADIVYRPENHK